MLKINSKLYRKNYTGEDIIQERTLQDGVWNTVKEHVPNNVINNQISNRAVVFGNGQSRLIIDANHILNKKSGLLGAATLQSYACNAFYRDHTPNFLVVTDRRIAEEISKTNYTDDNIVYTRSSVSLEFPRQFYLIPHDPDADAGTTATYLACFDGHKKIYLLGCEGQWDAGTNNNIYAGTNGYDAKDANISSDKWAENFAQIFCLYDDVDFAFVTLRGNHVIPESWKSIINLRQITIRDMVLEADL